MIIGHVNEDLEAVIRLSPRNARGEEHEFTAIVDTGFNGALTMRPQIIQRLGLEWPHQSRADLADGTEINFNVYRGFVLWGDRIVRILVDSADVEPLVGMSLLEGYELNLQVRQGGSVNIRPLGPA